MADFIKYYCRDEKCRFAAFSVCLALAFLALALVLPPQAIVNRLLPGQYTEYRDSLIQGLRLFKAALALDAAFCLALLWVRRGFLPRQPWRIRSIFDKREVGFLALIIVGALFLRLPGFSSGFSYDEIFIYQSLMTKSLPALFARAENWRALYAFFGNLSCHALGPSEIAARIPALCFGIASIPAAYLLVRKLAGSRIGYLTALLLGLSTFHVWYSQDASTYSMVMFFTLISFWAFPTAIEEDLTHYWVAWGFASFFAIYSHWYIGFLLLAGQGLYLVVRVSVGQVPFRRLWQSLIIVLYVLAAFFTVCAITLPRLPEFLARTATIEIRGPLWGNMVFMGQWLLNAYAPWSFQVYFGTMSLIGFVITARRRWDRALYLVLPLLIMLAHMAVTPHKVFCARYVILMLTPVIFFSCVALTNIPEIIWTFSKVDRDLRARSDAARRSRSTSGCLDYDEDINIRAIRRRWVMGVLLLPLLVGCFLSLKTYYSKERYSIRPAAEFIFGRLLKNDRSIVKTVGEAADPPEIQTDTVILNREGRRPRRPWVFRQDARQASVAEPVFFGGFGADKFSFYAPALIPLQGYEGLKKQLDDGGAFWLVYWFPSFRAGMPQEIRDRLEQRGELKFQHTGFPVSYSEHDYESFCWKVKATP